MRITTKGQVTIPQRIRNRFGLKPGTPVEFVAEGRKVVLRPKRKGGRSFLGKLIYAGAVLCLWGIIAVGGVVAY